MKLIHCNLVLCALLVIPAYAHAAENGQVQERSRQQVNSQLVTPEERAAYQDKMQTLTTQQERDALRQEHIELLKTRASEQGLPEPQTSQGRMGSGQGGAEAGSGRAGGGGGGGGRGGMGRGR